MLNIYNAWRDTLNQPLAAAQVTRMQPFGQFKFSTYPLLPGRLTPQKLGLTYCWMLYTLLQLEQWPGHTRAVINEQRQQIGVIDIDNERRVGKPASASPGVATVGDLSNPWSQLAHRWARCLLTVLQLPITHAPQQAVTNDPQFAPKPGIPKYSFPCRTPGLADRLDLFIYPAANAGSPTQLTWEGMIRSLITWTTRVAAGEDGGASTKIVSHNVLIAEISVYHQPNVGGDEAGTATA
ncbi:MAG: hypothetical protein Q9216_005262 [Gyalolechia sp. 2 TL-2023]